MPTTPDARLPGEGPRVVEALYALAAVLTGEEPFDRAVARQRLEELRTLLGASYASDSTAEMNLRAADAAIAEEGAPGSVEVARRRTEVGETLKSWADALRVGRHSGGRPGTAPPA